MLNSGIFFASVHASVDVCLVFETFSGRLAISSPTRKADVQRNALALSLRMI